MKEDINNKIIIIIIKIKNILIISINKIITNSNNLNKKVIIKKEKIFHLIIQINIISKKKDIKNIIMNMIEKEMKDLKKIQTLIH